MRPNTMTATENIGTVLAKYVPGFDKKTFQKDYITYLRDGANR
jgi:hypothetical protein